MKKFSCIICILALILGLFGCGGNSTATPTTQPATGPWLEAGFARVDVTPDYKIGLDGVGDADTRISQAVSDPLTVTCVAMKSEKTTILIYTADTLGYNYKLVTQFRPQIQLATGVPQDNIFFGATHSHSAPRLLLKTEEGQQYLSTFITALMDAGNQAISNLAPAKLQAATTDLEGMNFVRHYKMSDGSYAGPNFGTYDGLEFVDYSGTADPELSMIKLDRGENEKDILMLNWQAHPNNSTAIGYYTISADFVGKLRDKLENDTGMQVAYFTGASGNVHIDSKIAADAHNLPWNTYGEKLAELTVQALPLLKDVGGTGIQVTGQVYKGQIDHSWDHLYFEAQEVMEVYKTQGKAAATALCKKYDFSSHHHARTVTELAKTGPTMQLELRAFRVGDVGFTTGTYEMWTESGKYVKDNSPFDVTFIITGNLIYIPAKEAFAYRNYEVDTTYLVEGTAELLVDEYVKMLNSLK